MPLRKVPAGEKTALSVIFGKKRVKFYGNSSIEGRNYDKITNTEFLTLADYALPIGLTTITLREYTLEETSLDTEDASARLEQALMCRLEQVMAAHDGTVLRTDVVTRVYDGKLTVTLLAECEEQIGKTVVRPGETGRIPGINAADAAD